MQNKKSKTPKQNSQAIVKYRMRNFNTKSIENSYKQYQKLGLTCSTVQLLEDPTGKKQMKVLYKFNSITFDNCLDYCKANDNCICILTGERSKIIVRDADQKDNGMEMWNKLVQDNEDPDTLKVLSGNQGVHYYFKLDDRTSLLKNKSRLTIRNIKVGIEVRSKKGIIYAPPTTYHSVTIGKSKSYKFLNNKSINKMPSWLWDELNHIDNIITIVKKKNILIKPTNKMTIPIILKKKINNKMIIQTLNHITNILANIKVERFEDRDKWIKLGMILHHEFKGNDVGLYVWKTYSWYKNECLAKWRGFNINNNKQLTKSKLHQWELEDNNKESVDAGDYIKFVGKMVDYNELKDFIKKTFIYIFDGGNAFWISKNIYNNEIEYKFLKDLNAFNKKFIKYKNPLFNINDDNSKPWIKESFANILEEVSHELQYKRVDFIPKHKGIDPNTFNLFTSFEAKKIDNEIDESKIDRILWHIRYIWCKNNDDLYNYIINWLAHLMQKPYKKIEVAILLKSKQGAGKNVICEFIGDYIIGKQYSLVLGDIDRLFARFNVIMQNRLLTILDEISNYGGAHKSNNKLKNLITQKRQMIEFKGLKPIRFTDYNNYIFLSNNDWPIKVEQSDRRFFCLELDNCKCGKFDYFNTLAEQLNADSANIFYNYLLNIDIRNWNKLKIPTTNLKNDLKINSLPKPIQFLVKCVEGEIDSIMLSKDESTKVHINILYELFIDHFGNYRNNISKIDSSRQFNKFGLKSKPMKIGGNRMRGYVLDYNEIITKLKDLKIDIDEKKPDAEKIDAEEIDKNKIHINHLDF